MHMKNFTYYSLIAIIGIIAGFYLGRESNQTLESIKYVKGETIEKTIAVEIPYQVEIPANPIYIYKTDTIHETIVATIDTMAILNDWVTKRDYHQNLFDDSNGKLFIEASIQYNQLQSFKYNFTPYEKTIVSTRKPTLTPYIEASYNTLNHIGIGGGVFYHNIGLGIKYTTDFDKKGLDIGLKYKF
jgi:hypothetical protein